MVTLYDKWIVVDTNNYTQENLDDIKAKIQQLPENKREKLRILVGRSTALSGVKLYEDLCSNFPGVDFFIKVDDVEYDPNFNASQVFTREEMAKLFEGNSVIERNGAKLYLSGYTYGDDPRGRENKIPFSKVIQSNARMNNWVDKINKARVNGKPLSPFEKYLYAYQIVTQFKYTDEQIFEARDISRVLSSKFIVCAGYSSILSELCRRVGIVCKRQGIHAYDIEREDLKAPGVVNHEECILYLNDPKYGIDGFFITDPTQDSLDMAIEDGTSLAHALIALDEHGKLYNKSEDIMINDFNDFSDYFFLRDVKVIPDKKLFYESEDYITDVSNALDDGLFDADFTNFMQEVITNIEVPEKFDNFVMYNGEKYENIHINDDSYNLEQIAGSIGVLTNLAFSCYSNSNLPNNPDTIVIREFFENALAMHIKNRNIDKSPEWTAKLINKFINIAKDTDAVTADHQLLSTLADYHDFCIVSESGSDQKFKDVLNSHPQKSPTLDYYKRAMRVVYMARGDKREQAKKQAVDIVSFSVWHADAKGWAGAGTNNPFAVEALRAKPVQKLQEMQIKEISPYLEQVGITEEYLNQVIMDKNEEEFERILDLVEEVMPKKKEKQETSPAEKTDNKDNKTIRAWNVSKRPKFWDDSEAEQISTIDSKIFSE